MTGTSAIAFTLIETAKLNAIDPSAGLADTHARISDYKTARNDDLLPWRGLFAGFCVDPAVDLGRRNVISPTSFRHRRLALIETAKLNAVDPHAWLADTLARIPDYKITKVDDLLPWRWNR